jgi:hypothetical protein
MHEQHVAGRSVFYECQGELKSGKKGTSLYHDYNYDRDYACYNSYYYYLCYFYYYDYYDYYY